MPRLEPEDELAFQLDAAGIAYVRQFRWAKPQRRRFRADFGFPDARLLVEVEGGVFRGDVGHNSVGGILRDMDKLNCATLAGYRMLRVHATDITDGEALRMIEQALGDTT